MVPQDTDLRGGGGAGPEAQSLAKPCRCFCLSKRVVDVITSFDRIAYQDFQDDRGHAVLPATSVERVGIATLARADVSALPSVLDAQLPSPMGALAPIAPVAGAIGVFGGQGLQYASAGFGGGPGAAAQVGPFGVTGITGPVGRPGGPAMTQVARAGVLPSSVLAAGGGAGAALARGVPGGGGPSGMLGPSGPFGLGGIGALGGPGNGPNPGGAFVEPLGGGEGGGGPGGPPLPGGGVPMQLFSEPGAPGSALTPAAASSAAVLPWTGDDSGGRPSASLRETVLIEPQDTRVLGAAPPPAAWRAALAPPHAGSFERAGVDAPARAGIGSANVPEMDDGFEAAGSGREVAERGSGPEASDLAQADELRRPAQGRAGDVAAANDGLAAPVPQQSYFDPPDPSESGDFPGPGGGTRFAHLGKSAGGPLSALPTEAGGASTSPAAMSASPGGAAPGTSLGARALVSPGSGAGGGLAGTPVMTGGGSALRGGGGGGVGGLPGLQAAYYAANTGHQKAWEAVIPAERAVVHSEEEVKKAVMTSGIDSLVAERDLALTEGYANDARHDAQQAEAERDAARQAWQDAYDAAVRALDGNREQLREMLERQREQRERQQKKHDERDPHYARMDEAKAKQAEARGLRDRATASSAALTRVDGTHRQSRTDASRATKDASRAARDAARASRDAERVARYGTPKQYEAAQAKAEKKHVEAKDKARIADAKAERAQVYNDKKATKADKAAADARVAGAEARVARDKYSRADKDAKDAKATQAKSEAAASEARKAADADPKNAKKQADAKKKESEAKKKKDDADKKQKKADDLKKDAVDKSTKEKGANTKAEREREEQDAKDREKKGTNGTKGDKGDDKGGKDEKDDGKPGEGGKDGEAGDGEKGDGSTEGPEPEEAKPKCECKPPCKEGEVCFCLNVPDGDPGGGGGGGKAKFIAPVVLADASNQWPGKGGVEALDGDEKKPEDSTQTPPPASETSGDEEGKKPELQEAGKGQKPDGAGDKDKKEPADGRGETRAEEKKPPPPPPPEKPPPPPPPRRRTRWEMYPDPGDGSPPPPVKPYAEPGDDRRQKPPQDNGDDGKSKDGTSEGAKAQAEPTGKNGGSETKAPQDPKGTKYGEVKADPCDKELWIGVFFEGARPAGTPASSFSGTTIDTMKKSYSELASAHGANGVAKKFRFTVESTGAQILGSGPYRESEQFKQRLKAAVTWACTTMCAYINAGCDRGKIKIDVFGWSRGAIAAMFFAGQLSAGTCNCGTGSNRKKLTKNPIRFLGLIDPVDTNLLFDYELVTLIGDTHKSLNVMGDSSDRVRYDVPPTVGNVWVGYAAHGEPGEHVVFYSDKVGVLDPKLTKDLSPALPYNTHHRASGWPGADSGLGTDLQSAFKSVLR